MTRFYVPQPHIEKGTLRVEGSEVRHIRRVLRLNTGDEITIFDGSGNEYQGRIAELQSSSILIQVNRIAPSRRECHLEITLAQSLLKGEKMDTLIQKATELGVKEIVPFFSSRSVPLLDRSKRGKRRERWEKIAIEASKQCGRAVIPRMAPIQNYAEMLEAVPSESLRIILWEREGAGLREVLQGSKGKKKVFFIVGPEGGLSQEEVEQAKGIGCIPVLLGKRILRSEPASLCLLSILQYDLGDVG